MHCVCSAIIGRTCLNKEQNIPDGKLVDSIGQTIVFIRSEEERERETNKSVRSKDVERSPRRRLPIFDNVRLCSARNQFYWSEIPIEGEWDERSVHSEQSIALGTTSGSECDLATSSVHHGFQWITLHPSEWLDSPFQPANVWHCCQSDRTVSTDPLSTLLRPTRCTRRAREHPSTFNVECQRRECIMREIHRTAFQWSLWVENISLSIAMSHLWGIDNFTIDQKAALIEANTVWGLLRGLETFSQLIYVNDQNYVREHRWWREKRTLHWLV